MANQQISAADGSAPIAIIGAGMAGTRCAFILQERGYAVTLFDKSRDIGGRMATRHHEQWQWDHGAQFFDAETEAFARFIEPAPIWQTVNRAWRVGAPTQNQLVKSMSVNLNTHLNCRIVHLSKDTDLWWLHDETARHGPFSHVVLAIPAPQAQDLLADTLHIPALNRVQMHPCWTLMVAAAEALNTPVVQKAPSADIAWIAADHTKPERTREGGTYVIQASTEWSRQHLEASANEVVEHLVNQWQSLLGHEVAISYATAHRWRYALTAQAAGQPYLLDQEQKIGLCGDWCLGARVEDAFLSGSALAERLCAELSQSVDGRRLDSAS